MIAYLFLDHILSSVSWSTPRESALEDLQSILIIYRFCIWEVIYQLKSFVTPKSILRVLAIFFIKENRVMKKLTSAWCSCSQMQPIKLYFSSHSVSNSFKVYLCALLWHSYHFYWLFHCWKWPQPSAEALSSASKWKKALMLLFGSSILISTTTSPSILLGKTHSPQFLYFCHVKNIIRIIDYVTFKISFFTECNSWIFSVI